MSGAKKDFVSHPGNGAAWRNVDKRSEKAPDWRGDITLLDGTQVNIAVWEKQGRGGVFLSFALSEKMDRGTGTGAPSWGAAERGQGFGPGGGKPERSGGGFVADNDIPF